MNKVPHKPIKSYVLRQGRLTAAQRRALDENWAQYGLEYAGQFINLQDVFGRTAPCILEIGFGNGESLLQQAIAAPEVNFIGIEVHSPGVGALLLEAKKYQLTNLRVFQHDAVEVLQHSIPNNTLAGVQIFFPDPWPKKRHHKRRLIQPAFVDLLTSKLKPNGKLHCATDWQNYAEQMMAVLSASQLVNAVADRTFYPDAYALRPLTKFEQRGLRLGHSVWDLLFVNKRIAVLKESWSCFLLNGSPEK